MSNETLTNGLLVVRWCLYVLATVLCVVCTTKYKKMKYPETKQETVIDSLHGRKITDNYRWLETHDSPEVQQWIKTQEKFTYSYLHPLSQRSYLIGRFNKLWRYDDERTPRTVLDSNRLFYWARKKNWERWAYYYKENDDTTGVLLLNPNDWKVRTLDFVDPSRDGNYIAYGVAEGGDEATKIHIMDVNTGKIFPDMLRGWRQYSVSWLPDNSGFFYSCSPNKDEVPEGEEYYWRTVYMHKLGTPGSEDMRVFGHDSIKEYYHNVHVSEDGRYLIYYRSMFNKNEVFIKELHSTGQLIPIVTGFDAQYGIDIIDDKMFIWTDADAPKGKVLVTDVNKPEREHWIDFIPETDDNLHYINGVAGHLYAIYSHNAHTVIKILNLDGTCIRDLPLPTMGSASVSGYWSKAEVWVRFASFTYPQTTYIYDVETDDLAFYHRPPIEIDLSAFETHQVWYTSKDGTRISMFLVYHRDLSKDGKNPVYLTGYGGFNIPMDPYFSTIYSVWLESGGMIAIPNLRGGGEYGKEWHEAGMLGKKQNVFDDFIAAAEWLIDNNYTNSQKLIIGGGSNGGLLVGAAVVQRPDLFKAVYCSVPLLDMLRYHKFGFANVWTEEYGHAEDPQQLEYLLKYSPYHNVLDETSYPPILFVASENDARCFPLHAMKMTARMQLADPQGGPIMLIVQKKSGHGFGTTLTELVEQYANIWSFLMEQAGIKPQTVNIRP